MMARYINSVAALAGTLFVGLALAGCPSARSIDKANAIDSTELELDTNVYREGFPWGIRPGSCRVVATLLRVDPARHAESPKDPCGVHPCRGWVVIDTVLGCGDGVTDPLQAGDTVLFSFVMTLNDTRDLGIDARTVYPGLVPSDRFGTDVLYLLTPASESPRTDGSLTVYDYSRRTVRAGGTP